MVSYQDDASRMRDERITDPLILALPKMRPAASLQSVELYSWQANDANLILQTWKDGHQVWVSKHLLATQPKPDWNWVEGDDVRIHWRDFPAFFSRLQTSAECCGEDGYVLLAQTPENIHLLTSFAQSAPPNR